VDSAISDALKTAKVDELKAALRLNDQLLKGSKAELIKRITECLANGGALPRCPTCSLGKLQPKSGGGFKCPGAFDDDHFVPCGWSGDAARTPWKKADSQLF